MDLKKDGVFSLRYGANKYVGSWQVEKEDKMVELEVTKVNGDAADVKNLLTSAFLGVMDRKDGTMRLYPLSRRDYEESKQRGDQGFDALSVRLKKG